MREARACAGGRRTLAPVRVLAPSSDDVVSEPWVRCGLETLRARSCTHVSRPHKSAQRSQGLSQSGEAEVMAADSTHSCKPAPALPRAADREGRQEPGPGVRTLVSHTPLPDSLASSCAAGDVDAARVASLSTVRLQ